jgi:hypothetical protein
MPSLIFHRGTPVGDFQAPARGYLSRSGLRVYPSATAVQGKAAAASAQCGWTEVWRGTTLQGMFHKEIPVTEAEWLEATDPRPVLDFLHPLPTIDKCRRFLVVFGLVATLCGCGRETSPMIDTGNTQPPVDLRRLVFRSEGIRVDTLESDEIVLVTDTWMLSGSPVNGRQVHNTFVALNGVVQQGPGCIVDVVKAPSGSATVHRFLRGVTGGESAVQGDYLIHVGDHWIVCTAFARRPAKTFNTGDVDSFLLSLSLSDAPRADAEIPRPWKQYQKTRKPGTPEGKFVLFMAPAPVYLGSHQKYLEMLRSLPRKGLRFTPADDQRGGRQMSPEIIEFFPKDDRCSVRVDVRVGSGPEGAADRQAVYDGELRVTSHAVELWSSDNPCSLAVAPGLYDVRVTLVKRGRCEEDRDLTHRERFERDDLERYEITMTLKDQR